MRGIKFMKTLKYLIIIIFTFIKILAAQNTINVGVLPFIHDDKKASEYVVAELTRKLVKYKFIKVIERSLLKEVLKEIEFGQTGLVDQTSVIDAGKLYGIEIMITGVIKDSSVSARAIHVQTGKVISSSFITDVNQIEKLGYELVKDIEVFLTRENLKTLRNNSPQIETKFWIEQDNKVVVVPGKVNKLNIGSSIVFHFISNKNGYLTVIDIQPNGDVVILYPNKLNKNNKIKANIEYSIPSKDDGFQFALCEPAGRDTAVAFFTTKKVEWLDQKKLTGENFWSVKKFEKFHLSRGIELKTTKLKKKDWETHVLELDVAKKNK